MGHRWRGPGNHQRDNLPGGAIRVLQLRGSRDSDRHLIEFGGETPEKYPRGSPNLLKTDNGPQFASEEFRTFTTKWKISHVISSPLYPKSNGLSEAGVKVVKSILKKKTN